MMSGFRYAFSLSRDEIRAAKPPGTVTLIDHVGTSPEDSHDVLRPVPQPSTDPADPLNLPQWRKFAILGCMSLFAFIANVSSSSISSTLTMYAHSPVLGVPPQPLSKLNHLTAVNVIMLGGSNLWWVPLSNTFGRRSIVLLSLLILVLASVWAKLATSFESLLAARAIMGIGGGPSETVSPNVLGEIFFVHERGRAMAIYTVFLCLGSVVGGVIGGYLVALGFDWLHWINVILAGVTLVLCLFFQSETLYERKYNLTPPPESREIDKSDLQKTDSTAAATKEYPPFTYLSSLKIGTYRPGLLKNFKNILHILRLPGVWLVSLWYAALVGAMVAMTTSGPSFVSQAPYFWGKNAGLVNLGGFFGSALGGLCTYLIVDWLTKHRAKKDKDGIVEPEPRLVIALPGLVIGTLGTLIFGFVGDNPSSKGWLGLEFGVGMVAFGLMQAPSVGFNYIIESYPSFASDCFVATATARGIVAFAWTFFVASWVEKRGAAEPYGIFGMIQGLTVVITVPYIIYGKRFRIATAKWIR